MTTFTDNIYDEICDQKNKDIELNEEQYGISYCILNPMILIGEITGGK